jgi:hypothetical protein
MCSRDAKPGWIVAHWPDRPVAAGAEQTAHLAGLVVVIDLGEWSDMESEPDRRAGTAR